jgi:hypothetical protein
MRMTVVAFALACGVACVALPAAAAANVIVVSSLDESALQSAVDGANDGDVITFPLGGGTIGLTAPIDVHKAVDIEGCGDPNAIGPCITLQGAPGFDAVDVTVGGATLRGLAITGSAIGIHVTGGSSTTIAGPAPSQAMTITGSAGAAVQVDSPATGVVVDRVSGLGNGGPFISLAAGANGDASPPAILSASATELVGLAPPGALVRVYAAPVAGSITGFVGSATADPSGIWELAGAASTGESIAVTQTGASGTSPLTAPVTVQEGASPAPTVVLSGAGGTVTTATPTFGLTPSDPAATVLCRIDGGPYAVCPASYQTATLSAGQHMLSARAVDGAGLGPEVSAPFTVKLVTGATITAGPPRFGHSSSGVFRFTVAIGTRSTQCAIDGRRFKPCSTRFATGYLLDGRHVFHLRTTDAAGQTTLLDTVFTIDTLAPRISLASTQMRIGSGIAGLTITCPASEPGGCTGSARIGQRPGQHRRPGRQIGSIAWQAGPAVADTVLIPVPAWAIAASRHPNGMPITIVVTAQDNAGNVTLLRRKGRLLPPVPPSGGGGVGSAARRA